MSVDDIVGVLVGVLVVLDGEKGVGRDRGGNMSQCGLYIHIYIQRAGSEIVHEYPGYDCSIIE